jgi:hypothetical protein
MEYKFTKFWIEDEEEQDFIDCINEISAQEHEEIRKQHQDKQMLIAVERILEQDIQVQEPAIHNDKEIKDRYESVSSVKETIVDIDFIEARSRNLMFLEAMKTIGVESPHYVVEKKDHFCDRIYKDMSMLKDLQYKGEEVLEISFPSAGIEMLTPSVVRNVIAVGLSDFQGINKPSAYCYGVRDKLDGDEVLVFSVRTKKMIEFFFWEGDRISQCTSTLFEEPIKSAIFEKIGDVLYDVMDLFVDFEGGKAVYIGNKILFVRKHQWFPLSTRFLSDNSQRRANRLSVDGIVLNIRGVEYKSTYDRIATLKQTDHKMRDSQGNSYEVDSLSDIADYRFENGKWFFFRNRKKIFPDSFQTIDVLIKSMITPQEIVKWITPFKVRLDATPLQRSFPVLFTEEYNYHRVYNEGALFLDVRELFKEGSKLKYVHDSLRKKNCYDFRKISLELNKEGFFFYKGSELQAI